MIASILFTRHGEISTVAEAGVVLEQQVVDDLDLFGVGVERPEVDEKRGHAFVQATPQILVH